MTKKNQLTINSSEIYDSFTKMSVEGMIVVNEKKVIRTENKSAQNILGYSKNELNGKNILNFIPAEERKKFNTFCDKFLKSGKHTSGIKTTIPFINKKKKTIYTEISLGNHIHSSEGPLMIMVFSDITNNIQKEEELEKSKERFSKAFHSSPAPSAITQLSDGCYKDINNSFSKVFGFKREEVIGKTALALNLYRHSQPEMREKIVTTLKKKGKIEDFEITFSKKSGEPVDILFSAELISFDGEDHILSTMIDITEKKKIQESIKKQNEALERKVKERTHELTEALSREKEINELKSRFVTIASHEFRTPLASLLSSTSLLEKYTNSDQDEKLSKHFNRIKNSVNKLTEILNYFVLLEKMEKGKEKVTVQKFRLDKIVQTITVETKEIMKEGQTLEYTEKGKVTDLHQDKNKIHYAIYNLVSNAIKYSPENKPIEIIAEYKTNKITVSVKDCGMGIPLKEQKNIFSLFFRAKNAEILEGTGLGLNIVKKYMEFIDGEISFTSKENKGSCFKLEFPISIKKLNLSEK